MTNQEIINKVNEWQNAGFVHPLTCGNSSLHRDLVPEERECKVILVCLDCDYVQDWIPNHVLGNYIERNKSIFEVSESAQKINRYCVVCTPNSDRNVVAGLIRALGAKVIGINPPEIKTGRMTVECTEEISKKIESTEGVKFIEPEVIFDIPF